VFTGTTIQIYYENALQLEATTSAHQTATKHGLLTSDDLTPRFSSFKVYPT
jgi:hypothetical protein